MTDNQGWQHPFNTKKWHYFRDRMSLCGRWALLGGNDVGELDLFGSPDNCKECERKRKKEAEKDLEET